MFLIPNLLLVLALIIMILKLLILIWKFLKDLFGFPKETDFSKIIKLPTDIRTENAPHLILTVSARDCYTGILWEAPLASYWQ